MVRIRFRIILIVCFVVIFLASYFQIVHLVSLRGRFYSVAIPGEEKIPFLPWSFFIYALVYVVPVAGFFLLETGRMVKRAFWAFFSALWIHEVIWYLYPVKFAFRPSFDPDGSLLHRLVTFFYGIDQAALNCFPSLHVTYAFMTYYGLKDAGHRSAPLFLVLAVLISASTLTFKQHYLLDIVAGVVVASLLSFVFFGRSFREGRVFRAVPSGEADRRG